MLTDAEISKALGLLGLLPEDLRALRSGQLDGLKAKAKKNYKKAAAFLHPDLNSGDAEKTADFVLISTFIREFLGMQLPVVSCKRATKRRVTIKLRVKSPRTGVRYADGSRNT